MGAKNYRIEDFRGMDPEELEFIYFWAREAENEKMMALGKLLGTYFLAEEIRSWARPGNGSNLYKDKDKVLLPLSIALRPELKEALVKLVGHMPLPQDYKKGTKEVVIDLSRVSTEDFKYFMEHKRLPEATLEAMQG